jgi:archaellum component FlaC
MWSALLIIVAVGLAAAQDTSSVEQKAEALREQLRGVTDKQAELQSRLTQLEEDLKPENIQRSVASIGTTDANALRDQRQQQLETQKASIEEQL